MKIAIIHYHLRGGGVTRVISHACRALAAHGHEVVVLSGEAPVSEEIAIPEWRVIPQLQYENVKNGPDLSPDKLLQKITGEAAAVLGSEPDLWHIHNHSLGKNLALPRLVSYMARHGCRMLLQMHDFAEDGRPANYRLLLQGLAEGNTGALGGGLYPQGEHVHYATLNCRDHAFLAASGAVREQLHLLPNAIDIETSGDPKPLSHGVSKGRNESLILYPTRAIRRKNLGEFLLWSALGNGDTRWAVTLAPRNPAARPVYERWVKFAVGNDLPVEFEFGPASGVPFAELLHRSDAVFTTSVAEGFGLAFLEPWLVGTPVMGRDLPEITAGFADEGIDLEHLYARLDVPVEWIALDKFRDRLAAAARESGASYGVRMPRGFVDRAVAAAVRGGRVDFGRLDEEMQEQVLKKIIDSETAAAELSPNHKPPLEEVNEKCFNNGPVVREEYSLKRFGERLLQIYAQVESAAHCPQPPLNAEDLLEEFMAPERFSLLRS